MSAKQVAEKTMQLDCTILGREYKFACKESERAELMQAVALLDKRMREIRDAGKVTAVDRIAVMAAVNLAHDLLRARSTDTTAASMPIDAARAQRRIQSMQTAIDQLLAGQEKLI
ncbi:MAG: cell division protein ZapA [Vicinamibacteria bacterium]|jgi:cell division protein ZapA